MTGPGHDPADVAERRLAEALRLQAAGAASPVPAPPLPPGPPPAPPPGPSVSAPLPVHRREASPPLLGALVVALLAGALLGVGLALLSILAPGLIPALG